MAKQIQARIATVEIEAVRNGYRLKAPAGLLTTDKILADAFSVMWAPRMPVDGKAKPKTKPAPKPRPAASGEYVFPDFASLTAFLRANLKHGGGVES